MLRLPEDSRRFFRGETMEAIGSRRMLSMGVVVIIYTVTALLAGTLTVAGFQLRPSLALVMLCMFNRDHLLSLALGASLTGLLGGASSASGTGALALSLVVSGWLVWCLRDKLGTLPLSVIPAAVIALAKALQMRYYEGDDLLEALGVQGAGCVAVICLIGSVIVTFVKNDKNLYWLVTAGEKLDKGQ